MTLKKFDDLAKNLFGSVLAPLGFSAEKSRYCIFYKKVSDDIYCFVMPSITRSGDWYYVMVFPASPLIDPQFKEKFPDDLGIPTDVYSYLHSVLGVGMTQELNSCRDETEFRTSFEQKVKGALIDKAMPYLSQFKSLSDLVPMLKSKLFLGAALYRVGQKDQAQALLQS